MMHAARFFGTFALLLSSTAAMAQAPGGGKSAYTLRLFAGIVQGRYRETAKSELLNRNEGSGGVDLEGQQVDLGFVFKSVDVGLDYRTWVPDGLDSMAKRSEVYFTAAYLWPTFPFVAPVVGYYQATQTPGDASVVPAAFIETNKSFIFGVRSHFIPLTFGDGGKHGILVHAHALYLTTLEATRNFGTETDIGLGYSYALGQTFRLGLTYGQWRNFFSATKADPDDAEKTLGVRQVYIARHFGLYLQF